MAKFFNKTKKTKKAIRDGFRSNFESDIAKDLRKKGVNVMYEVDKLEYTVPSTIHKYTPDFTLPSGILVEAKGRLTMHDRKKMLHVIASNPELDIRFVFQKADQKIRRGSKTTYGMWCDKHGIKWAEKVIPLNWIK